MGFHTDLRFALRSLAGVTVAADLEQLSRGLPAGDAKGEQPLDAGGEGASRVDGLERVAHLLAQPAPVAQPDGPLGGVLRTAEELKDAAGIARAPGVLQQQAVEHVRDFVGRELQRPHQPHADQTGARRMSRRMSLGYVERRRQARQHGRHQHGLGRRCLLGIGIVGRH